MFLTTTLINKKLVFILFVLSLLVLLPSVYADGGITASLSSEKQVVTVGDVVNLFLEVRQPDAREHVIFPELAQTWGDFEVREQYPPELRTHEDGSQSRRQTIAVTLWAVGRFTTPPLTVTVSTSSGELSVISVEPLTLTVASVLTEDDPQLRQLKPQATLVSQAFISPSMARVLYPSLLSLFILLPLLFLFWRWRSKPPSRQMEPLPAYQVALNELLRIKAANLPALGDFKTHYTLVTDILRRFLEHGYMISAMDQTTSQIKERLEGVSIAPEHKLELISILGEADLIKFANLKPEVEAAEFFPERVSELILAIRPIEVEPSVADEKQVSAAEVLS